MTELPECFKLFFVFQSLEDNFADFLTNETSLLWDYGFVSQTHLLALISTSMQLLCENAFTNIGAKPGWMTIPLSVDFQASGSNCPC